MSKSCIIFACTIISYDRLIVLHDFLKSFKDNFSDVDIFVGINHNSLPETENIISQYQLNVVSMSRCKKSLYSNSDASAYQVAMKQLVNSKNNQYENYWFIHTKSGVNTHSDYLRSWYINNFIKNRKYIESFINESEDIGSYGLLGLELDDNKEYNQSDCEIRLFKNNITKELPFKGAKFFYIHTLYVINKKPMEIFLNLISNNWFKTKLDRYYFEGVFPFIVSRSGYFPYIENRFSCSVLDLKPYIDAWITENNLVKYKKYSDLFKTSFKFNQLNPPYVNSNTQS